MPNLNRIHRVWLQIAIAAALLSGHAAAAEVPAVLPAADSGAARETAEDADEEDSLRDRLTEREDRRRPLEPYQIPLAGRPLTLGGELEAEAEAIRRRIFDPNVAEPDRARFEAGIDLEAFYSFGAALSLFAQVHLGFEQELLDETPGGSSGFLAERGEMWLIAEGLFGLPIALDLGRLDFEDDRRWWWDTELDSLRISIEPEPFELSLAVANELLPKRMDLDHIAPEQKGVLRVLAEATLDHHGGHSLGLFGLFQDDRSASPAPEEFVPSRREDDSDAQLGWFGGRALGVFELGSRGLLGYWLDAAGVRGQEEVVEFEDPVAGQSEVENRFRRDVSGFGIDAGLEWILPLAFEPRIFGGYAFGSGDTTPDFGSDHSFRQSSLQSNEAGFGGVEHFSSYGLLLDPELSNLGIATAGIGFSLFRSSSLDLVYHRYRQDEPATSLRDAELEAELTGIHRRVGDAVDLVFALEEWERFELEFTAAAFRASHAFGAQSGDWSYGGALILRYAF